MVGNFFKRVLGNPVINLGNMEGDYRVANLKSDIAQSLLHIAIANIGILALLRVDAILFRNHPSLFKTILFYRLGYLAVSLLFSYVLSKTNKVRNFDRLAFSWIFFTILFLLLINFTRPIDYVATSFDIVILFAFYLLSPLKIQHTIALALGFSLGTVYIDYFFKIGIDPLALSVASSAQVIVHILGINSIIQFQSHRRKSFKAYIDERDAKEMVAYLANIDPLTKSLTRRHFFTIAETEFNRFMRYHRSLSILILDADRFKHINDTYGHHAGDLALRSLSLVAMEQKRAQDTFGRLGGEEFGLLMPETSMEQALVVAERIRLVWEKSPVNLDGELIHSTMSIGLAEAISTDKSLEDILRRADEMLYKAKTSGRNQVVSE